MNNNPYAINLVQKQHEQDIIRFIERGRGGSIEDKAPAQNNIVRRIVKQLVKRA